MSLMHGKDGSVEGHRADWPVLALHSLGFSCAILACALYITKALDVAVFALPQSMGIIGAAIIFLLAAAKLSDSLVNKRSLLALKLCIVVGGIGSLATLIDMLRLFGAISAALFICASILLYGSMLSYCRRRQLLWTTALSFVAVGLFCMLPLAASLLPAMVFNSLMAVASGICLLVSRFDPIGQIQRLGAARSPAKNAADKGNRFTLVAIGISVGAVMLMGLAVDLDPLVKALVFGGTIVAASLLTLLFRLRLRTGFEDLARRSIAVVATAAILPYSFVGDELKCLCVSVLLFSVTTSCIILIGAIAETARIKRIPPFWITGYEGAIFMGGCLLAMLGLWYGLFVQPSQLAVVCIALVAAFIALQVFIENQTYPYFDGGAESAGICTEPKHRSDDLFSGGGVRWRERMDAVATEHKLSPRQKEVMRLLLKGRDVVYIMNKFVISQATAKTHVYNLYKKLGVHSRHELLDLIEQPQDKKPTS